ELAAARPNAVQDLRGVARADLAHLDPRAQLARQVAHQVAEVDSLLGVEVHGRPAGDRVYLDVDHLHQEAATAREALAGRDRALLALAALAIRARLLVGRRAQHARVGPGLLRLRDLALRPADPAQRRFGPRLYQHQVAHVELEIADPIVVGLGGGSEPNANETVVHVLYPMPPAGRDGSTRFRVSNAGRRCGRARRAPRGRGPPPRRARRWSTLLRLVRARRLGRDRREDHSAPRPSPAAGRDSRASRRRPGPPPFRARAGPYGGTAPRRPAPAPRRAARAPGHAPRSSRRRRAARSGRSGSARARSPAPPARAAGSG